VVQQHNQTGDGRGEREMSLKEGKGRKKKNSSNFKKRLEDRVQFDHSQSGIWGGSDGGKKA